MEQTTGDFADTKDGVSTWFPVFIGSVLPDQGRDWENVYWVTSMD